ncbi:MAG: hypothetical protein ACREQY_10125 [Candidatus Binatia bacterium]
MPRFADHLLDLARRLSAEHLLGSRRAAMAAALLLFGTASLAGVSNLPEIDGGVRWGLLVLAGATLVSLGTALNAAEFALSAKLLGHTVGVAIAFRTALIAGAFNLLPFPGAAVVRTQTLYGLGSNYPKALGATLVASFGTLGTALAFTGAILWANPAARTAAVALLGCGALLLAALYVAARRETESRLVATRLALGLILIGTASIAVKALRVYLVIVALRQPVTSTQAAVIALLWVLTLFAGFFPGGLGIRELLAAGVSPLVGLHPSVGVTTSAVDRLMGVAVLWILTLLFLRSAPSIPRVKA